MSCVASVTALMLSIMCCAHTNSCCPTGWTRPPLSIKLSTSRRIDWRWEMRSYIKRETAQARAYSQAVITEGGRIVWLAGQVGAADASGRSLGGDFDGQVREVFSRLGQTLEEAGGTLADMVTMTVFITDARYGDRFYPSGAAEYAARDAAIIPGLDGLPPRVDPLLDVATTYEPAIGTGVYS